MKTVEIILTDADLKRIARIRKLRYYTAYTPTDEEIIRTALFTYWIASEEIGSEERANRR